MPNRTAVALLIDELAAFVLSASCPGCDAPGTLLCDGCRSHLRAAPTFRSTRDGMPVVSALAYEGVAARCIRRMKEEGQTVLARPLGAALAAAAAESAGIDEAMLVPVPTSRAAFRRRGYRVPELLMRRAGLPVSRMLVPVRRTADQRELDIDQRRNNVAGSLRARHARQERMDVVLFDDVVTTGSTLDEAFRALDSAGFRVLGAVTLASTERHRDGKGNSL